MSYGSLRFVVVSVDVVLPVAGLLFRSSFSVLLVMVEESLRGFCVFCFLRDRRLCFSFGGLGVGRLFRLSRWWCLWVAAFRRRLRVVCCLGLREYGMCFLRSCSVEAGVVADLDSFCSGSFKNPKGSVRLTRKGPVRLTRKGGY